MSGYLYETLGDEIVDLDRGYAADMASKEEMTMALNDLEVRKMGLWRTTDSKVAYQNNWIRVVEEKFERPDGTTGIYGVVKTKGGSALLPAIQQTELFL